MANTGYVWVEGPGPAGSRALRVQHESARLASGEVGHPLSRAKLHQIAPGLERQWRARRQLKLRLETRQRRAPKRGPIQAKVLGRHPAEVKAERQGWLGRLKGWFRGRRDG